MIVIVYKLFFDSVPAALRERRNSTVPAISSCSPASTYRSIGAHRVLRLRHFHRRLKGLLWPFLAAINPPSMTATVGITETRGDIASAALLAFVACTLMFPVLRRQLLIAPGQS